MFDLGEAVTNGPEHTTWRMLPGLLQRLVRVPFRQVTNDTFGSPPPAIRTRSLRKYATRVVLAARPARNSPVTEDHFRVESDPGESEVTISCTEGGIVAETLYLSTDPFLRCRFNEDTGKLSRIAEVEPTHVLNRMQPTSLVLPG